MGNKIQSGEMLYFLKSRSVPGSILFIYIYWFHYLFHFSFVVSRARSIILSICRPKMVFDCSLDPKLSASGSRPSWAENRRIISFHAS